MDPTVHSLVLSAVDWEEVCPWLLFRKCLRSAFSFRLLLLTTLHLLIVSLWLAAAFGWFSSARTIEDLLKDYSCITAYVPAVSPSAKLQAAAHQRNAQETNVQQNENAVPEPKTGDDLRLELLALQGMNETSEGGATSSSQEMVPTQTSQMENTPPQTDPSRSTHTDRPLGIGELLNRVCAAAYAIFSTLLLWLVTVRLTALRLTREFRSSFRRELKFSLKQIGKTMTAFFWIVLGAFLLALPLLACRLFPENLTVWLMPAALIYAVFYFFFLLGTGLGSLFIPSVFATENSDTFDALSRSFAYVLQKPMKLVLYLFAALLFGVLGLCALVFFVVLIEHLCLTLTGAVFRDTSPTLYAFTWSISAYLFLYGVSALQGLYLLLRRDVDAVELETVWLQEPQGVPSPQLPKLETAAEETA
ncbi:MAG: hypothetical protein IJD43_11690 [Thermoguttaceae bacterium]|nr:hypothetical protein [Thermoguttaceae bacterium]